MVSSLSVAREHGRIRVWELHCRFGFLIIQPMKKRKSIVIGVSVTLLLFTTGVIFTWLFAVADIGGIFVVAFLLFVVPSAMGAAAFFLFYIVKVKISWLIVSVLVLLSIFMQFNLTPCDPSPWGIVSRYAEVYPDFPNKIIYEDLVYGDEYRRAAAIVKYEDDLPDMIATWELLDTDRNPVASYWAELRGGDIRYDTTTMDIVLREDTYYLVVEPDGLGRQEIKLWLGIDAQFKTNLAAREPLPDGNGVVYHEAHDCRLHTGASQVFAWLLRHK